MAHSLLLRFRAPDRPGIVAAIAPLLAELGCDIREAQVYGDPETETFFCRIVLASPAPRDTLEAALEPLGAQLGIEWELLDLARRLRVVVAVSKFDHCLIDLVHKTETGQLPIEIVAVVSNHDKLAAFCGWHGLPFHHLPMGEDKLAQEHAFEAVLTGCEAELVVLARYMQILSDGFARRLENRCINIHHSFLPSFKGAKPYHQAHARGVKLIGATAHYVTSELDEGPIIEQDVRRITHAATAEEMVAVGREAEASVLSRAVRWHAEHRVFLNGMRTVVLLG